MIEIFEAAMSDSENSEPEVVQDEEEPMEESEDEEVSVFFNLNDS